MSSNALPTLQTSGSVGSKFVSQEELDDAKRQKEEEWKAAYARSVYYKGIRGLGDIDS